MVNHRHLRAIPSNVPNAVEQGSAESIKPVELRPSDRHRRLLEMGKGNGFGLVYLQGNYLRHVVRLLPG